MWDRVSDTVGPSAARLFFLCSRKALSSALDLDGSLRLRSGQAPTRPQITQKEPRCQAGLVDEGAISMKQSLVLVVLLPHVFLGFVGGGLVTRQG
jgi:hypothetical protein